jgi:hypothetical protein
MRALATILLLTSLALAGCATKSDTTTSASHTLTGTTTKSGTTGATTTTRTATSSTSGSSSATSTPTSATANSTMPNTPPTAALQALNATGSIPFNVTFTASGSDPDHDPLNYTLVFGDGTAAQNGTQLPATIRHQYTLLGNFTARLTVSDGMHSVNATILVKTLKPKTLAPQSFTASTTASSAACPQVVGDIPGKPPFSSYPSGTPAEGVEWAKFTLAAGSAGLQVAGQESYSSPAGGFGGALDIYDASSTEIGSNLSDSNGHYSASIPTGAVFMVWYPCGPGPATVSLTVS